MAVTAHAYFPFDSGAGADSMEDSWRKMMRSRGSGVIQGRGNDLEVYADSSGRQVKIKTGECRLIGHHGELTSEIIIPIAANATGSTRIDRIVARADFNTNVVEFDALTGTASAPALTQNNAKFESYLAQVSVANGATNLAAGTVTNERSYAHLTEWEANSSADLTLTTSDQDCTGATLTVYTTSANARCRITGMFDFIMDTAGTGDLVGSCMVDGVSQAKGAFFAPQTAGTRATVSQTWGNVILASAGAHTIKLRAKKLSGGGSGRALGGHTSIDVTLYPAP